MLTMGGGWAEVIYFSWCWGGGGGGGDGGSFFGGSNNSLKKFKPPRSGKIIKSVQ